MKRVKVVRIGKWLSYSIIILGKEEKILKWVLLEYFCFYDSNIYFK